IGQGKQKPVAAEETVRNGYGDCKSQVALLAALLAARGIASEPALIDINNPRYTLPEVPMTFFNHVILYVPEFGRYLDSTWQPAAFGVLPWGHYGKPVLHAVAGKSHLARVPPENANDNFGETRTIVTVSPDGHLAGTTREIARGTTAANLRQHTNDTGP